MAKGQEDILKGRNWFKPNNLPDWSKPNNPIENMASVIRAYRKMGYNVKNRHWEMTYDHYAKLQGVAHRIYGCNLKRALRKFGLRNKVRHKTRNGYWVWMK